PSTAWASPARTRSPSCRAASRSSTPRSSASSRRRPALPRPPTPRSLRSTSDAVDVSAVRPVTAPRVGLALAGGGAQGAIYELGALRALDEAIVGIDLNALDVYFGVSAGAFIGSCLANGFTPAQMCRAMVQAGSSEHPLRPDNFLRPALREWMRRA